MRYRAHAVARRSPRRLALSSLGPLGFPTLAVFGRIGHERAVAIAVAAILLGASFASVAPSGTSGATGGPNGDGPGPRIAIGGDLGVDGAGDVEGADGEHTDEDSTSDETASDETASDEAAYDEGATGAETSAADAEAYAAVNYDEIAYAESPDPGEIAGAADVHARPDVAAAGSDPKAEVLAATGADVEGPFLDDGTLLKPVVVDTSVADGSELVQTYKVKAGDTLVEIAKAHGVSMMTLWWANKLKNKDDLHQGQVLRIPPVSGLVVKVKSGQTMADLAKEFKVTEAKIMETNGIDDPNLVVGQVLVLPGAKGDPIPTPKPKPKPTRKPTIKRSSGGSSGGSARPPKTYSGGNFRWPTSSHHISQYYHYGHYGIDIDGSTGNPIYAATSGTVTFAGWKSNGGGYQVWIAHGSGLYTTYNHMSSVSVGRGQHVSKGQRVGRMGASGNATGSHLHFEVWKGAIWNGGRRVNPLAYL